MLNRPWSLLTVLVLAAVQGISAAPTATATAGPSACLAFDTTWNLYAFGFGGKDYNAGTSDTWGSGTATDVTKQGRPPFNSPNTSCYLSQFNNAIYVLNADSSDPAAIYIYDVTSTSWSKQAVTKGQFDPTNFQAILDHDTNVFYAYSNAELYSLSIGEQAKKAQSSAIEWTDIQKPDLSAHADNAAAQSPGANTDGYSPTIALAQNHVHFLGVNGLNPGQAKIFVIHFSYMQPEPQSYGNFPTTHGKAASFFEPEGKGVQQEFAFIPDDGSATYVVNVLTNTTKTLAGPPKPNPAASYSASTDALVQLTPDGKVSYLSYDGKISSGGTWQPVSKLPAVTLSSGDASSLGGTSGSNSSSGSGSGSGSGKTGTGNGTSGSGSQKGGAVAGSASLGWGMVVAGLMAMLGASL